MGLQYLMCRVKASTDGAVAAAAGGGLLSINALSLPNVSPVSSDRVKTHYEIVRDLTGL